MMLDWVYYSEFWYLFIYFTLYFKSKDAFLVHLLSFVCFSLRHVCLQHCLFYSLIQYTGTLGNTGTCISELKTDTDYVFSFIKCNVCQLIHRAQKIDSRNAIINMYYFIKIAIRCT